MQKAIWKLLERLVGIDRLADFAYEGMAEDDLIVLFRHTGTGRYISIGPDGQTYRYENGFYLPIPAAEAVRYVYGDGGRA